MIVDRSSSGPLGAGVSTVTFSSMPSHEMSSRFGDINSMSLSNRITPSARRFGNQVFALAPSNQASNFFISGSSSKVMNERSHHPGDLARVTW